MNDHPTSHAAEGDSAFVDRLRAIPGLVRKAPTATPATPAASSPFAPSGDAGALAQRLAAIPGATRKVGGVAPEPVPVETPYGQMVEVPAPAGTSTRSGAFGPRVRHFGVLAPKMQTRVINGAIRHPGPAA